jgi:mitogen-activated protein kinase kinase kinase
MRDPNIVRYINVTETDDEEGMIAISMEYVPGGSITYLLKFFKSFKEPLVKIYVNQVVKVLWRLHKKGLVHRDIKTSNLLVDDLGTIKLSDFGFIKEIYEEF